VEGPPFCSRNPKPLFGSEHNDPFMDTSCRILPANLHIFNPRGELTMAHRMHTIVEEPI